MAQIVFVDANVLYSRTLRDWLFMLRRETGGDVFRLRTSQDVIGEATARLRDNNPEADSKLISLLTSRIKEFVDEIVTDFPGGPVAWISDQGDWHVHHAAVACGASVLLTEDKGFESDETEYEAYTCDDFFTVVARSAPREAEAVAVAQAKYWHGRSEHTVQVALRSAGCPEFARVVDDLLRTAAQRP